MANCELLDKCGFFRKHQESQNMACRSFIRSYCTGLKMADCERKKIREKTGVAPDDDMMPTGQLIPKNLSAN